MSGSLELSECQLKSGPTQLPLLRLLALFSLKNIKNAETISLHGSAVFFVCHAAAASQVWFQWCSKSYTGKIRIFSSGAPFLSTELNQSYFTTRSEKGRGKNGEKESQVESLAFLLCHATTTAFSSIKKWYTHMQNAEWQV